MKFSELVPQLDLAVASSLEATPDLDPDITGVTAIQDAEAQATRPNTISYVEGGKFTKYIATTQAAALILPNQADLQQAAQSQGLAWVSVKDPRLGFARAIALFYQPLRPAPGIHPTAVIDPSVTLGENVSIGAHAVLQPGVRLGRDVCIHPNVVVYPQATLGDGTTLHANCVIHERTQIGANCVIHSGAAIGSEGFGFVPTATGWEKMHQSGRVVLEDGVEIGCNSCIDRPAVGETRIGQQTKLDNLIQIAHGCQVGQGVAMAAQVGMAGGVTIGNRVILAGQVGVANQAKIGDGAVVTAQSGVLHNIAPGETVSGSPSMPYHTYLKVSALIKRLPELSQTLKALKKAIGP
ncbi:MAG: UDP-3-O-(3-hydroxymyristoyl)glucosamine N-acyltransferase [Cyanobacteria bacterium P01_A01_bin.105]